ncbi:MAG TPA: BlaI/MecI/CopY family transcriptional regulator [Candidatus Binatia bacterium]|jgi:BlaI family penicillinase repressor|nr:BlaI/MecI/CopY family transcriptional regulator [Candidatus Binatia bacterium]
MNTEQHLSRRERQIMDVLHARGEATAAEVLAALPEPPGYSAVRALLRILENKGHLKHRREGARYVFVPRTPPEKARRSALNRVVSTFFQGSVTQAMAALLEAADTELSEGELNQLQQMIKEARKEGR